MSDDTDRKVRLWEQHGQTLMPHPFGSDNMAIDARLHGVRPFINTLAENDA